MLGSSLANLLAEKALEAAIRRLTPPLLVAAVSEVALPPTMQALKCTGPQSHLSAQEHCQLMDEWLDLQEKHHMDLVVSNALNWLLEGRACP